MSEVTAMMRRSCPEWAATILVFVGGMASLLHGQPVQQGEEQISKILSDWAARNKRCRSVCYVVSGTVNQRNLPASSKLPVERPENYVVLLDLIQGRSRIEKVGSGPGPNFERYIPRVTVSAYDGKILQGSIDRKVCELGATNADISLVRGPLDNLPITSEVWPTLLAHGVVPTVNKPARVDQLPIRHTAEEFELRGQVIHAGHPCMILRTDPVAGTSPLVDEFWIDPTKDSAIIRHTYFAAKNPWFQFDITYQKSEHGWLPGSWVFAHYEESKLAWEKHFTVDRLEVDPAVTDADFTLPIPPGSIVATQNFPEPGKGLDPFKPANGLFRVDEDGKWITLEETGFTTAEGVQLPPEPRSHRWLWWIGSALIGTAFFTIGALLYRRRMRRLTNS